MQKAAFTFAKQYKISTKAVLVSGYDGCLKRRKTTNFQVSIFQISMMQQVQMLSKYIDSILVIGLSILVYIFTEDQASK
jgi:hypothetical protein